MKKLKAVMCWEALSRRLTKLGKLSQDEETTVAHGQLAAETLNGGAVVHGMDVAHGMDVERNRVARAGEEEGGIKRGAHKMTERLGGFVRSDSQAFLLFNMTRRPTSPHGDCGILRPLLGFGPILTPLFVGRISFTITTGYVVSIVM